ncbi:hypothetical protein ACOME3_002254 [Neoechinorhynchus agilis]
MFDRLYRLLSRSHSTSDITRLPNCLESLKQYNQRLQQHLIVSESNVRYLIETLRGVSEVLIWGDQNDSSVFEYFLEKQMITYFLRYIKQANGHLICVQLLQTLNILFENIVDPNSLYYLLSNNHVNRLIEHQFDFDTDEVSAYYITFLKILSLRLSEATISFFFDEHKQILPLYEKAASFFDNPDSMIRVTARTAVLKIFQVKNEKLVDFLVSDKVNHLKSISGNITKLATNLSKVTSGTVNIDDLLRHSTPRLRQHISDELLENPIRSPLVRSFTGRYHRSSKVKRLDRSVSAMMLTEFLRIVGHFEAGQIFVLYEDQMMSDGMKRSVNRTDDEKYRRSVSEAQLELAEQIVKQSGDRLVLHRLLFLRQLSNRYVNASETLGNSCLYLFSLCASSFDHVRLVSVYASCQILQELADRNDFWSLLDTRCLIKAKEVSFDRLKTLIASDVTDESLLDLFESEYESHTSRVLNLETFHQSEYILLKSFRNNQSFSFNSDDFIANQVTPISTIKVYFSFLNIEDPDLPLRGREDRKQVLESIDLTNCDIVGCRVVIDDDHIDKSDRFVLTNFSQLILIEPEYRRIGFGSVVFALELSNLSIDNDINDSCRLIVKFEKFKDARLKSSLANAAMKGTMVLKFLDRIRCLIATGNIRSRMAQFKLIRYQRLRNLFDLTTLSSSTNK